LTDRRFRRNREILRQLVNVSLELNKLGDCQSSPNVRSLCFGPIGNFAFNIVQGLEESYCRVCPFGIRLSRVFPVSICMREAACLGSTASYYLVKDRCAISLQDVLEPFQNTGRIMAATVFGEVVENIWNLFVVAPVLPEVALMYFPLSFDNQWHLGGV